MDLNLLWGLGLIPLILALVQVFKAFVPDHRFYPLIAVAIGIVGNLGIAYAIGESFVLATVLGVVAGLSASGLYSTGSAIAAGKQTS